MALMFQVSAVREKQTMMVSEFVSELKVTLEQMGIDGGRMSEENLKNTLNNFEQRLLANINEANGTTQKIAGVTGNRGGDVETFKRHFHGGLYKRVPESWRFPRCGVADLWRHWMIGDTERQISPLRFLDIYDIKHLDMIPLSVEEQHGRKGPNKHKRRMTRKTLLDMRYLMNYVRDSVIERGTFEVNITIELVDKMFESVADLFSIKERDAQKRWTSVVNEVRKQRNNNNN